ncbi:MAG: TonB-dependent receptor [Pseudomonadota bacterium]
MKLIRVYHFLIVLLLLFSTSFAFAKEEKTSPTQVYSLGEVVVSGDQIGTKVNTRLEIDKEEIERKNIKTLDKALELLPGVDVSKGTAGIPRVNIRGFRSRHTVLLLNGIPVNSTWDQQFDPHLIPTENISKIKLSYGTNSVLYGQGGLAGVINIITKQGTQGLNIDASADINERGNHYSKANISGGKDQFDFFAGVSQNHAKGFSLSDDFTPTGQEDGGLRENSDDKSLNFFGNLGFKLNDDFSMGLTLEHGNGEFGIPPSTISDSTDPFYKSPKFDRVDDYENFSSQVSADYSPGKIFAIRGWAFINTHDEDYARYDQIGSTGYSNYNAMIRKNSYRDKTQTQITGTTLQPSFDFESAGDLILSFSGQKDEYTSDLAFVAANNAAPTLTHSEYDITLYSAAAEYRINLVEKLDIVAGFSHHWQKKDVGSDENKSQYMIGSSFDITDTTTFRASFAQKIRFPSIRQLYDSDNGGNTSLKPEESKNYEAGLAQELPWDMVLDLNVFLNDVKNYIEKDSSDTYANNEEYEFKGFEVRLAKSIFNKGQVGVSYSYLETKDKSAGTLKDELQYRPENKVVVDASYSWDFGLTASADFTYTGKQYFYNDTNTLKKELSDYSIFNIKLEQKIYKDYLALYIGADNLFNENYQESYGFPQPGRSIYIGARAQF